MRLSNLALLLATSLSLTACGDDDASAASTTATTETDPTDLAATDTPTDDTPPEVPPPLADPNEACAQVIVVAYAGAAHAADTVTRDEAAARARAEELRQRVDAPGADFAAIARAESDAASSGPRGGLIGTYTRDDWPAAHDAIKAAVFTLQVGQTTEVLEAPYGFVVARRCPVEKIHTRHILVRYRGARNAPDDITRTKEAARALAAEIKNALAAPGADFAAIARDRSEDASAERGGDLGEVGRGRLAPEYEAAAFALTPNQISDPIETEFGFHIIQRLE